MTMILNRTTGKVIARSHNLESAFSTAIRLGFAASKMSFVKDEFDILIYELAAKIAEAYEGLPEFYMKKHIDFLAYEAANSRDLWTRVKNSRVSLSYTGSTSALSEIIGEELAADVELLAYVSQFEVARIICPLTKRKFQEAYSGRYVLEGRLKRPMMAAKHPALGVIVVAPEEYVAARSNRFVNLLKKSNDSAKTA